MVEYSNKKRKDEVIKAEILEAAGLVFQKWGLNKTTMEDIAQQAGKGKSSLYYYYESKEAIFETVIMNEFDKILSTAKKNIQILDSAKDQLKKYIVFSLTEIKNTAMIYTIVRNELKKNKAFIEKIRDTFEATEIAFVKSILIKGIQSKEFNFMESELDVASKTVFGIIYALDLYLFLNDDDNIDINQKIDITARLIANGL